MHNTAALIRVLIVDDEWILREGLRSFLAHDPQILLIGGATNGSEAIEMTLRHDPDIIIMDISMPVLDGLSAAQQIKTKQRRVGIIFLALESEVDLIALAVKYGAGGFLLKNVTSTKLIEAVKQVYRSEIQIDPLAIQILSQHTGFVQNWNKLTPREIEVARLIQKGLTNGRIAEQLHIKTSTVKAHIFKIMDKLGVTNRMQISIYVSQFIEQISSSYKYSTKQHNDTETPLVQK